MNIALHKNARTTPATRAEIAASGLAVRPLSSQYGVCASTIVKWRARDDFQDRSHTAHHTCKPR